MELFGFWQKCNDANHYFLHGVPLCGKNIRPTGQEPARYTHKEQHGPYLTNGHCAGCYEANWRRWNNRGVLPTGG